MGEHKHLRWPEDAAALWEFLGLEAPEEAGQDAGDFDPDLDDPYDDEPEEEGEHIPGFRQADFGPIERGRWELPDAHIAPSMVDLHDRLEVAILRSYRPYLERVRGELKRGIFPAQVPFPREAEIAEERLRALEPRDPFYRNLWLSTVRVVTEDGAGSGFFLSGHWGLVVTCAHCVVASREVQVQCVVGGALVATATAEILAMDVAQDLAVLRVDMGALPEDIRTLRIGASPAPGDAITLCGFPHAVETPRLAKGIVSGYGQSNLGHGRRISGPILDVSVNPGNSGGPVVNDAGELVGVIYAGRQAAALGTIPGEDAPGLIKLVNANDGTAFALDPRDIEHLVEVCLRTQGKIKRSFENYPPKPVAMAMADFARVQSEASRVMHDVEETSPVGPFSFDPEGCLFLGWGPQADKVELDAEGWEPLLACLVRTAKTGGSFILRGRHVYLYRPKYKGFIVKAELTLT